MQVPLRKIARARSGDKGRDVNIGVLARRSEWYSVLEREVTEEKVQRFFKPLGAKMTTRFLLPNLDGLNFVLEGILHPLRIDAQGKALGQALLEMEIDVTNEEWQ